MSNGGYFQIEKGPEIRKQEIQEVNDHYDEVIKRIINPNYQGEQVSEKMQAILDAGARGLDRLKWDMAAGKKLL